MRTRTITAGLLTALLTTTTLAGCVLDPIEETPDPVTTPTTEPAPEPEPEPEPVLDLEVGDTVETDTVLPDGLRAYELDNGDLVVIDPAADLPQVVIDDLESQIIATLRMAASPSLFRKVEEETGKQAVIIQQVEAADGPSTKLMWALAHYPEALGPPQATREAAIASAEAIIAGLDNPNEWVILVHDE